MTRVIVGTLAAIGAVAVLAWIGNILVDWKLARDDRRAREARERETWPRG